MTSAPRTRAKTRDRIIDSALELFVEVGYTGATITEIERRVGLTPGTGSLYRHFSSKEEILRVAVEREATRVIREVEESQASLPQFDDPAEQLAARYERVLHDIVRWDGLFRLMLKDGERAPELREAIWAVVQRPVPNADDESVVIDAIAMAALAGYHLFSTMQGRPFNNVKPERFIERLVAMTSVPSDP